MTIIGRLADGRTIATATSTILTTSAGVYSITFTFSELRKVDAVLEVRLQTQPLFDPGTPAYEKIDGNTVGLTLVGVASGGTITGKMTAVGY